MVSLKIIQVYTHTISQKDEEVEQFYTDLDNAMSIRKFSYTIVILSSMPR